MHWRVEERSSSGYKKGEASEILEVMELFSILAVVVDI